MVHEYVRYYTRVNVYIPLKKRIIDNEREREGEREREREREREEKEQSVRCWEQERQKFCL